MTYTILSARYANEEGTAAIVQTAQVGAVVASQKDTPALWATLTNIAPYSAPVTSPAEQIEALERETLLPRPVRDFMLISMEIQAAGQGITPAQLRDRNPGYRRVKMLDEQIAALRALL